MVIQGEACSYQGLLQEPPWEEQFHNFHEIPPDDIVLRFQTLVYSRDVCAEENRSLCQLAARWCWEAPFITVKLISPTATHAWASCAELLRQGAACRSVHGPFMRQLLSEISFGFFHPESWRDELLVLAVLRDSPIPGVRPQWVGFRGTYILSVTCRAYPEVPREPILRPLTTWPFLCRLPEGKVVLCRTPGR